MVEDEIAKRVGKEKAEVDSGDTKSSSSIQYNNTPPPLKRKRTSILNSPGAINGSIRSKDTHVAKPVVGVSQWQQVTEDVLSAVVSIQFSQPISFDTEPAVSSEATGFIVDSKRGIILTNRHVVGAGPFVGEAIMYDHEEVEVTAIYRDPIHDFGFLRFDPTRVKYMNIREIPLDPESAKVGIDIRVIGNDAGEKLSILAGSISRVDRNAPEYGELTYNDFNTFYLQAASSLSGGSSGSPVIDVNGNAVGLQAGGRTQEATNFFLPLDRVKRALKHIQEEIPVPRGTIQTHFTYSPFDEVKRLGLARETEDLVRRTYPDGIGMLVVQTALPEGPGRSSGLEEGDVLVTINGDIVTHFVALEECMDNNVGKELDIVVDRGGRKIELHILVQDLESISPFQFVTIGGAVLNNLSFQLACSYNVPVRGVYLADSGSMFCECNSDEGVVIQSVDSKQVNNITELIDVLREIPDRSIIPISFYTIDDVHTQHGTILHMDKHWSSLKLYTRDDKAGIWGFKTFESAIKPRAIEPVSGRFPVLKNSNAGSAADLVRSLVTVIYFMPIQIDGSRLKRCRSYGVVVDAERGLVVVSRHTIPINLGDVWITIAESAVIPGKVRFMHPTHNFVIVQYDTSLIGDVNIRAAPLSTSSDLKQGDATKLIAISRHGHPICINTVVSDTLPVSIAASAFPKWRSMNTEVITLESPLTLDQSSGVLADDNGNVQAVWLSFRTVGHDGKDHELYAGLSVKAILPALRQFQSEEQEHLPLRSLCIEVSPISIAMARQYGMSSKRAQEIQHASVTHNNVFWIKRVESLSKASGVLRDLDIILTINGRAMTQLDDLDVQYNSDAIDMVVLRDKMEISLRVETTESTKGTNRIVFWSGATFQEPHKAVLQQSRNVPSKVYISARSCGSPAYMYGLTPTMWVTQVNGKDTPDMDAFLSAVKDCPDNTYVRIRIVSFDLVPMVLSVRTCYHYWPTSEIVLDPTSESGWRKA